MIGIEFPDHDIAAAVEHRAFQKGLLALGCGDNAMRMSPALTFREDQARTALEIFEDVVADVEAPVVGLDVTLAVDALTIDCHDPKLLADFWCAALGYRLDEIDDEGAVVKPAAGPGWTCSS